MNKENFETNRTFPRPVERPLSQIFSDIGDHVTELVRSEIRLARFEAKEDIRKLTSAGTIVVAGAAFALYAVGFLLLGAVYAVGKVIEPWQAALIVGGGCAIIGVILLFAGRSKIRAANLEPEKTVRTTKENLTWMKQQIK